jgi:hypothetical protein
VIDLDETAELVLERLASPALRLRRRRATRFVVALTGNERDPFWDHPRASRIRSSSLRQDHKVNMATEVMTVARPSETDRVATLLQEAAETHHRVFRITDGVDEDWASWYADWLLDLSELSELLGARPVRSHLVHALVQLDRDHAVAVTDEPWAAFYARHLNEQFGQA